MPSKISPTAVGAIVAAVGALLGWFKVYVSPELLSEITLWVTQVITLVGAAIVLFRKLQTVWRKRRNPPVLPPDGKGPPPPTAWRGMQLVVLLVLVPAVLFSSAGCLPTDAYVKADRATFEAVTPSWLVYVAQDESLDPSERARRARTVETWDLRIRQAEKANAMFAPAVGTRGAGSQWSSSTTDASGGSP